MLSDRGRCEEPAQRAPELGVPRRVGLVWLEERLFGSANGSDDAICTRESFPIPQHVDDVFVAVDDLIAVFAMSNRTIGNELIGNLVEHISIVQIIKIKLVMPIPGAISYAHKERLS